MSDVIVPTPEVIFSAMSHQEIVDFGNHSSDYLCYVNDQGVLILHLHAEFRIIYEIYSTMAECNSGILNDLNNYGYKIIFSDRKLSDKFCATSQTFRSNRIDLLFDKEFSYYAYP